MKIRTRLTLNFFILITTLLAAISMVIYFWNAERTENSVYNRLYAKALTTAKRRLELQGIDSSMLAKFDKLQTDNYKDENVTVYDSSGREIYTNNDTIYYKTSKAYFDNIKAKGIVRYKEGIYQIVAFTYSAHGRSYFVSAGAQSLLRLNFLRQLRIILGVTFLIAQLIVAIIGYFFVAQSMKPIVFVMQSVKNLSPVEKSERLPRLTEKDEIAELIDTFNQLFDKLEDSFRLQKHYVTNVSHELNNPLTKIKTQLEVSLMQDRSEDEYRQMMKSLLEDVNDLTELMQDLMHFSMLSQGGHLVMAPFRLDEVLFEVRDKKLERFPEYNVTINFLNLPADESQLIVYGNRNLVSTAIKNIVDNACKYSNDKKAKVNLSINGNLPIISIQNTGAGIGEEDIPHIFEAFYRSPTVGYTKGYGIGLALAEQICKAHNIHITVESTLNSTTTFYLAFLSKI